MADEREGQDIGKTENKVQTAGRKQNDAQPLNASDNTEGAERYPSVRQDDAVESRSFDPAPKQGAGDTSAPQPGNAGKVGPDGKPAEGSRQAGFEGPQGDPAEGKR